MNDKQLLAIMAAIIAGAVDNEGTPAYPPDRAVDRALAILRRVEAQPEFRVD